MWRRGGRRINWRAGNLGCETSRRRRFLFWRDGDDTAGVAGRAFSNRVQGGERVGEWVGRCGLRLVANDRDVRFCYRLPKLFRGTVSG